MFRRYNDNHFGMPLLDNTLSEQERRDVMQLLKDDALDDNGDDNNYNSEERVIFTEAAAAAATTTGGGMNHPQQTAKRRAPNSVNNKNYPDINSVLNNPDVPPAFPTLKTHIKLEWSRLVNWYKGRVANREEKQVIIATSYRARRIIHNEATPHRPLSHIPEIISIFDTSLAQVLFSNDNNCHHRQQQTILPIARLFEHRLGRHPSSSSSSNGLNMEDWSENMAKLFSLWSTSVVRMTPGKHTNGIEHLVVIFETRLDDDATVALAVLFEGQRYPTSQASREETPTAYVPIGFDTGNRWNGASISKDYYDHLEYKWLYWDHVFVSNKLSDSVAGIGNIRMRDERLDKTTTTTM